MELITRIQVAQMLGITIYALGNRKAKFYHDMPKPAKMIGKLMLYDKSEMIAYFS